MSPNAPLIFKPVGEDTKPLLTRFESLLDPLLISNVSCNLRGTYDISFGIFHRGDCERYFQIRSMLSKTDRFEVIDSLSVSESVKNDFSSWRRSAGIMSVIFCPTASSAVYPNNRSAPLFQLVMIPSRLLLMMASSDESTIAESNPAARSAFNDSDTCSDS